MIKILKSYFQNIKHQDIGIRYMFMIGILSIIFLGATLYFKLYTTDFLYTLGNNLFDSIGIIVGFLLTLFGLLLSNSEYSTEFIQKVKNDNMYRKVRQIHGSAEGYLYFYKRLLLIEIIVQVIRIIFTFLIVSIYISTIKCNLGACTFDSNTSMVLFIISGVMLIFLFINTAKIISLMVDYLDRTEFYSTHNLS